MVRCLYAIINVSIHYICTYVSFAIPGKSAHRHRNRLYGLPQRIFSRNKNAHTSCCTTHSHTRFALVKDSLKAEHNLHIQNTPQQRRRFTHRAKAHCMPWPPYKVYVCVCAFREATEGQLFELGRASAKQQLRIYYISMCRVDRECASRLLPHGQVGRAYGLVRVV